MKIIIETIPHSSQRYPTCGDWQYEDEGKTLHIRVSELGNKYMEFLVGRHELDEAMLCNRFGVTEKQVDEYDFSHPDAGDDSFTNNLPAPYGLYHNDALTAEWIMARLLGIDWDVYTKKVEGLFE